LAVLRELAIVRDQAAREQDSPTRTLLNDGVLCAMARRPARELADLDSVRGLPMPVEHRYGPRIIEAAARAMALPEDQLPPWILNVKFAAADRVDKLLADIIAFCRERSIAPSLVTSRKDVACACRRARAGQPPQQCRLHSGWRKELLGDLLSQLP
jgi:ribonuclease D